MSRLDRARLGALIEDLDEAVSLLRGVTTFTVGPQRRVARALALVTDARYDLLLAATALGDLLEDLGAEATP